MSKSFHVVCPRCDAVNRVPQDRPASQAVCDGSVVARQAGLANLSTLQTNLSTLQNWVCQFSTP